MVFREELRHILNGQAEATGSINDDSYLSSSRQLIIKTITDSFSFSCEMGHAKYLIKTTLSLKQALSLDKKTKAPIFSVFVPTNHLHLVDESGFLLPVERWDVLNLGHFLKPNSFRELNPFPSIHVGDVHPERSSVDRRW